MQKLPPTKKRQSVTLTLAPSTMKALLERAQVNEASTSKMADHFLRKGMGLP